MLALDEGLRWPNGRARDDAGYRYLMTVLEAEGNTAEALRAYDGYRSLVRDEVEQRIP